MVSLACTTSRAEDVTLVTGRIVNPDRPQRVRVENQLDGPVWPPRRRGVPATGWTDDGFECVLAADETRALGYASPAPPVDPPLVVVETEPVDPEAVDTGFEPQTAVPTVEETPTGVVRALGSPQPPRDAVPIPGSDVETATEVDADSPADSPVESSSADAPVASANDSRSPETDFTAATDDRIPATATAHQSPTAAADEQSPEAAADEQPPEPRLEAADAWLGAIEARIALAEQLSGTTRLAVAADALEEAGGLDGVREIDDQLDADRENLREIADRAAALAERAETVEIPIETLDRLR